MTITATQRANALQYVVLAAAQNAPPPAPLSVLLPGVQPIDVLNALVGAIGTNFDAQLTTALNNLVGYLDTQLASAQQSVTTLQGQITADTVV